VLDQPIARGSAARVSYQTETLETEIFSTGIVGTGPVAEGGTDSVGEVSGPHCTVTDVMVVGVAGAPSVLPSATPASVTAAAS
jgi:hypothetical protein